MTRSVLIGICAIICASFSTIVSAQTTFKSGGEFECSPNHCASGTHGPQVVKITLDPGQVLDKSFQMGQIPCCGGDENGNGAKTVVPPGVKIETSHGGNGEWGIFDLRLVADVNDIGDDGRIRTWTVIAGDTYCGPSCGAGKGGVNLHAKVSLAQKPAP